MTLLPHLERDLVQAAERRLSPEQPIARRRWSQRTFALAAALVIGLGGIALAARYVIGIGAPQGGLTIPPGGGGGPVVPGSVRIVVRAPDPAGGPPWGLRVYVNDRGAAFCDIGRFVHGTVGVLGQDGDDGNDGLFHPLPPGTILHTSGCEADGAGHMFAGGEDGLALASGGSGHCRLYASESVDSGLRGAPLCPAADLRSVTWWLLGPQAVRVVFNFEGQLVTRTPAGSNGAVLVIRRARRPTSPTHAPPGVELGPGVRVTYRNGLTCDLIAVPRPELPHVPACPQPPPGYVPLPSRLPAINAARAPITLTIEHPGPRADIWVRFTAHVAAINENDSYTAWMYGPSHHGCTATGFGQTSTAVHAGQRLAIYMFRAGNTDNAESTWCPGQYHGTVYYDDPSRRVGAFTLRIPSRRNERSALTDPGPDRELPGATQASSQ